MAESSEIWITPAIIPATSRPPGPKRWTIGTRMTTNAAVGPVTWNRVPPSSAQVNPAMIAVWVLGLTLSFLPITDAWHQHWFQVKFVLVVVMSGLHGLYARWTRFFAHDANTRSARFYRMWNEIPALLLIAIVVLAVVKPF